MKSLDKRRAVTEHKALWRGLTLLLGLGPLCILLLSSLRHDGVITASLLLPASWSAAAGGYENVTNAFAKMKSL